MVAQGAAGLGVALRCPQCPQGHRVQPCPQRTHSAHPWTSGGGHKCPGAAGEAAESPRCFPHQAEEEPGPCERAPARPRGCGCCGGPGGRAPCAAHVWLPLSLPPQRELMPAALDTPSAGTTGQAAGSGPAWTFPTRQPRSALLLPGPDLPGARLLALGGTGHAEAVSVAEGWARRLSAPLPGGSVPCSCGQWPLLVAPDPVP